MKQKKIGDILYVFSTNAYEITEDTDATVIKIQEECIPAFAALNESLVSKFSPINYKLFCVIKPEWADYYDDLEIIITPTVGGTVTVSPASADMGEEITITTTPNEGYLLDSLVVMCGSTEVPVTDNKFTMPAESVTVTATFKQDAVPYEQQYFTIESEADNNNINISIYSPSDNEHFYISLDNGESWTASTYEASKDYINNITLNTGDKMLIKRNSGYFNPYADIESLSDPIFNTTYDFKVYGNVMSLIYGDDFVNKTSFPSESDGNLKGLFVINDKLTDASNLILPATTLTENCYSFMFYQCTSLTTAPILPALNIPKNSYEAMFAECSSLTEATLLATNWGTGSDASMSSMFVNIETNGTLYVNPGLNTDQRNALRNNTALSSNWTIQDYVAS